MWGIRDRLPAKQKKDRSHLCFAPATSWKGKAEHGLPYGTTDQHLRKVPCFLHLSDLKLGLQTLHKAQGSSMRVASCTVLNRHILQKGCVWSRTSRDGAKRGWITGLWKMIFTSVLFDDPRDTQQRHAYSSSSCSISADSDPHTRQTY